MTGAESESEGLTCYRCKCVKTREFFVQHGWYNCKKCKECHRQDSIRWRNKHRDRFNERMWEYYGENPDRRLFKATCTTAKKKGFEHDIKRTDILIPESCPYLGVPIDLERTRNQRNRYGPSVDRIDSSKGYIKGNIEVISYQANKMKNDATEDELIAFAIGVLRKYRPELLP